MFVDACAMISVLGAETDSAEYTKALDQTDGLITSSLAVFEACLVLSRPDRFNVPLAQTLPFMLAWLAARRVSFVDKSPPAHEVLREAIDVAMRVGVSRRKLSSLDCFHYAHAKLSGAGMITKDSGLRQSGLAILP